MKCNAELETGALHISSLHAGPFSKQRVREQQHHVA